MRTPSFARKATGRRRYPSRGFIKNVIWRVFFCRTREGRRERAQTRGRPLLKKLRRGLWGFNCSPRLWLESNKTPFANENRSLLHCLTFSSSWLHMRRTMCAYAYVCTYDDEEEEEAEEYL